MGTITAQQLVDSLVALPAYLPEMVGTGYVAAWALDLYGFRKRSMVERLFWSVPLSLAISTIAAQLIGRWLSLDAAVLFFEAVAVAWLGILVLEWFRLRRTSAPGRGGFGWRPLGGAALLAALAWVAVVVLSLADIQSGHRLFMNVAMLDQSYRVSWTDAILRTGIPPTNPLYLYRHPSPMRNYYAWYVVCAAVSRMAHLPTRTVLMAASVWAGFALAALNGLYLKHFLCAGSRLRAQFLRSAGLIMVTGLDLCVNLWNLFVLHRPPSDNLETWSKEPVLSWLDTLLWSPHHIAALVCCMLAFLLAWMSGRSGGKNRAASIVLIAAALASAFSLSVYVLFAFSLVMVVWALWQAIFERQFGRLTLLALGGAGSFILILPTFLELLHDPSKLQGGSAFGFAVRRLLPSDGLLSLPIFQHLVSTHPATAQNLASLILLVPGYALELGFYLAVLLIYLVPSWRGRMRLTPAQRSLLVITLATLPLTSFLRSWVLTLNDFGFRSVLLVQYCLLLLGSEVLTAWSIERRPDAASADLQNLPHLTPSWLRAIAGICLVIGAAGTLAQIAWFRTVTLIEQKAAGPNGDPKIRFQSRELYISSVGYAQMNAAIPRDAVVQFNPSNPDSFWTAADLLGVEHQTAITTDQPWCGAELGGDPSGCSKMAAAIDAVFNGTPAAQARATCQQYGIQYLVARVYDPAWNDRSGWVWGLPAVVQDKDFRVLDCER